MIAELPAWLSSEYGVEFEFSSEVIGYDRPKVMVAGGEREERVAHNLIVCCGADLQTLYPETLAGSGLTWCKLQMMRTVANRSTRLGPMLAAGLTLRHYRGFASCPSLPALERRLNAQWPDQIRFGIHVLVAQNGQGEFVLGDSHEYGDAIDPFDKVEIDELILRYLETFFDVSRLQIASRWHGVYTKHPTELYLSVRPAEGVLAVTGVGGAGMTLSFGVAQRVTQEMFEGGSYES